jgi:hypothetical protein
VLARCTIGGAINPYVPTPDYYDYREQASDFEGFSAVLPFPQKTTVLGNAGAERATFLVVAHDLSQTLGVAPAARRWFSPEEGRPGTSNAVMVSTHFDGIPFELAARGRGRPPHMSDEDGYGFGRAWRRA